MIRESGRETTCSAARERIWWRAKAFGGFLHLRHGAKNAGETPALRNPAGRGFVGLRNPFTNLLFQDIERESSVSQHDVVKRPDVEFRPEFLLCKLAQLQDFQLANLVRKRLAGPGNVAIDFAGHKIP